jgi:hypothetical protein
MALRLEHELIHLGGEAWPGGMRGHARGVWINRPGRVRTLRLLAGAAAVVAFCVGVLYYLAQAGGAQGGVFPLVTLY